MDFITVFFQDYPNIGLTNQRFIFAINVEIFEENKKFEEFFYLLSSNDKVI